MIERIYIHNFRCFENFSLDLSDHSSALVIGRNGSGKSTFMHALRVLQRIARGSSRVRDLVSAADFPRQRLDGPMRFELTLRLQSRRHDYTLAFEWPPGFREARVLSEDLTLDGSPVFTRKFAQTQLAEGPSFGVEWHTVALPVIYERPGEHAVKRVREFLSTMILASPIPAYMNGYSEEPTFELDDHATNFASCLRALLAQKPAAYASIEQFLQAVMPDFSSIENVERGERGLHLLARFASSSSTDSFTTEFGALSDGEKCYFLAAYIVAYNQHRAPAFCMWDEPDNHLALPEVGRFIIGLRKTARFGGQFLSTSHHPETIRSFSDESTFVFSRASHLEPTVARPLEDLEYSGDLINALLRDDVVPSP